MALLTTAEHVVKTLEQLKNDGDIDQAAHQIMALLQTVYDTAFEHGRDGINPGLGSLQRCDA